MDLLLDKFFDINRWRYAIDKGVVKNINKGQLYQLTGVDMRLKIYKNIKNGQYQIAPPHTALIPKDTPGEYRTVYINEPMDRILLSIINDLLFETCPEMIHKNCKSYQKGVGCGAVVKEIANKIVNDKNEIVGFKSDLSKYFDSVPIQYIDKALDAVENKFGKSALITVVRKYYHTDLYFDTDGNLQKKYQSLKQGCSVASWLADVLLYHIDDKLSKLDGYYRRYSDDMIFLGKDYKKAMEILKEELSKMGMKLNPKKIEYLRHDRWFKFLGFSIKNEAISLSQTRIKTFQHEIENRTIKNRKTTLVKAVNAVNRYLYKGNGEFSWATQILPVVNVRKDINQLNKFVMDCLRAVQTGKRKVGGLGFIVAQKEGCIARGTGRNVKANREKTPQKIDGYLSLGCMQNAIMTRRGVYNTLVMSL
jgi:retron-type reverse transcriptase